MANSYMHVRLCVSWLVSASPTVILVRRMQVSVFDLARVMGKLQLSDIFVHRPADCYTPSIFLFSKMQFFEVVVASAAFQASVVIATAPLCRYLPGDSNWPTTKEWKALNATVDGRLVATIPLGSPCHDPTYNAMECAILQSQWNDPQLQ